MKIINSELALEFTQKEINTLPPGNQEEINLMANGLRDAVSHYGPHMLFAILLVAFEYLNEN